MAAWFVGGICEIFLVILRQIMLQDKVEANNLGAADASTENVDAQQRCGYHTNSIAQRRKTDEPRIGI
jgi:hypothetical protein